MTHIMWLTYLAPDIQEAILFLPRVESGPDTVKGIDVRRIDRVMDWGVQRGRWHDLFATAKTPASPQQRPQLRHCEDPSAAMLNPPMVSGQGARTRSRDRFL